MSSITDFFSVFFLLTNKCLIFENHSSILFPRFMLLKHNLRMKWEYRLVQPSNVFDGKLLYIYTDWKRINHSFASDDHYIMIYIRHQNCLRVMKFSLAIFVFLTIWLESKVWALYINNTASLCTLSWLAETPYMDTPFLTLLLPLGNQFYFVISANIFICQPIACLKYLMFNQSINQFII